MKTNYHTHCFYCDGSKEPIMYVEEAIKRGFKAIGFSCHAPLPFENDWTMPKGREQEYLRDIIELKNKFKDKIEIYSGLEIDYFDGCSSDTFNKYDLDYTIGSVHVFGDVENNRCYSIDGTEEEFRITLNELFDGDIKRFAKAYYDSIKNMLVKHKPDILGHLDVIKKSNKNQKYFSETEVWYKNMVLELLEVIAQQKTIVEINTGGIIRGYVNETYPSQWIVNECKKLDMPVVISSDAHSPYDIDAYFDRAAAVLKNAGYKEQRVLLNGVWQNITI